MNILTIYEIAVNIALGILFSLLIGLPSYKKGYVDKSGLLTAMIVGTLVFVGGWQYFIVILAFFVSSSKITKYKYEVKLARQAAEKWAGRSYMQVIGAGGVAALMGLILFLLRIFEHSSMPELIVYGLLGAISTSNSDTWAVEIGALSNEEPVLITNPTKRVPHGTSGGVTKLGELASFLGAIFIAIIAALILFIFPDSILPNEPLLVVKIFTITFISGFIAEKIDSVLGATVQLKYWCPKCNKETDNKIHKCGTKTRYYRGYRIITNEVVNILSTTAGALIAIFLGMLV